MQTANPFSDNPKQQLPRRAYLSEDWFAKEQRELFSSCWHFAGTVHDFASEGDVRCVKAGEYALFVVRDANGTLRAMHNVCRHRGTELVEQDGNLGRHIMCPYHNWVYNLDGRLRGLPAQAACFPALEKEGIRLHGASLGVYRDLVFVHPSPEPEEPFEHWLNTLDAVPWPHGIGPGQLKESSSSLIYDVECNWKVFIENAIDGYHLAYLHKNTLGGPTHDKNVWQAFGSHLVWWSTERDGVKHRIPVFVEKAAKSGFARSAHEDCELGYGGVYLFFPNTLVTPNPWGFSVSLVEPVSAEKTRIVVRNWAPTGLLSYSYSAEHVPGYDDTTGTIRSARWDKHPLEYGDFQTEDIWVCEKMQRALHSPRHSVDHLACGSGGEATIPFFQSCLLSKMGQL